MTPPLAKPRQVEDLTYRGTEGPILDSAIYTPRAPPYHKRMRSLALALLALIVTAAPSAMAQPVAEAKPVANWLSFMVMIVLLIIVAIASFMSSRRGHQD
ncbi:hypothetical protein [Algisphaera agarilytica]|uniref:Uncharacterized protein n=1 Tax=Algisphaera agarilytica TaxID=1385975 RepID=A0A7X0H786_9BACT|nr:hypothetical protein [Algisphaera agarilytica]MBB6429085.1 hypothetical protein [Algisphaera agarilytica]